MGIELSAPPPAPKAPSRALAMTLASLVIVFVVAAAGGIAWTAFRHDVVLTDGVPSATADSGGRRAAKHDGLRKRDKSDGYSTWSDEHGATTFVPAHDLLVTLPAPYSYLPKSELSECICNIIENAFGDQFDDAEVRFVADDRGPAAWVVAVRSAEPIPPQDRRLRAADVRSWERTFDVRAKKIFLSGKPVLLQTGRTPGAFYVGKDHALAVSTRKVSDAKRILEALLDGPNPAHAT